VPAVHAETPSGPVAVAKEPTAKHSKSHHAEARDRPKHSYVGMTKSRGQVHKQGAGSHSWGKGGEDDVEPTPLDPKDPDYDDSPEFVYRLTTENEWKAAADDGGFTGNALDASSGFIHLSTADQVRETASRYFKGQANVLLIEYRSNALDSLQWESVKERNEDVFPHAYSEALPVGPPAVTRVIHLFEGPNGNFVFPDDI